MPMPVAHSLVGASLVAAVLPRAGRVRYWALLAAGAVLANAADLDFILVAVFRSRAWHRGFTHSLVFVLAVFLCLLLALGRARAREAAAFGLAYASHVLLDFATTKDGGGLELLWPFSADRLGLRWWGLSEIPSRLPAAEILKSLSFEFVLFAPPLLFLILLRRGVFRRKALPLLFASLLLLQPHAFAQSGRKPSTPKPVPGTRPAPTPADHTHYDKVRVVVSPALDVFVQALNEQGRLGYRLEKTVSYDGPEEPRRYAAVLQLDPGHTYDYVSALMPEDARYGDPFNQYPSRGYTLAHAYARTLCVKSDVYNASDPPGSPVRQETHALKSNVLLFMRRDADETQTKEYRTFKGSFALEGGQKKELQAALNAAPPGFRPVRLLFSGGPYVFNVTVLAERDLNGAAPPKVEYELVKEVFGFEDEVNRLATAGARYVVGGRNESVKLALMAREAAGAAAYTFKDTHQHRKEFPRMLAAGNSYAGLLEGDLTCDYDVMGQKLVFARAAAGAPAREYKILEISDRGPDKKKLTGLLPDASVSELQRLVADGFRVRDIFYTYGLHAILERQTERPVTQDQTSER